MSGSLHISKLAPARLSRLKTGLHPAPRTPFGVRFFYGCAVPRGGSLRSLTPGYIPHTPPACERSPEGCWEISPGLSEAIPGVCLTLFVAPGGCGDLSQLN
jgi:hypothetical protein